MKQVTITLVLILTSSLMFSQGGVGINSNGSAPATSAMLDIASNSKGVLIPRVSLTSTTDITTITNGNIVSLLVYNTSTISDILPGYYYWDGTVWKTMGGGDDADADPLNEIELPTGGINGQVLTTDGLGNYSWSTDTDTDPINEIQDLQLTGNNLTVTNNGTPTTIDLGPYLDNTDDQNIDSILLNGTILTVYIEDGTSSSEDLSALSDHDWYEVGGVIAPDNINDDIFTQGNVGIGTTNPSVNLAVWDPTSPSFHLRRDATNEWYFTATPTGNDRLGIRAGGNALTNEIISILTSGSLGIGTTAPTTLLDIAGDLRIQTLTPGAGADVALVADANGVVKQVAPQPVGEIIIYPMNTPPVGYLICDGSAISRTTYADLFAVLGTNYGAGDGSTTFNLPDLRGEFVRGSDAGRGVDIGRVNGSNQNASQVSFISNTSSDCPGCGTLGAAWSDAVWGSTGSTWENVTSTELGGPQGRLAAGVAHQVTKVSGSTRPRNVAMNYCIRF
jgi:microcystin-dependent protein